MWPRLLRITLILLVLAGLGMVSWPVTQPVNGLFRRLPGGSGWHLSVDQANWVFWKGLELRDLKIQVPGGGKIHFVRIWVAPGFTGLLQGRGAARCRLQEGRVDPSSWGVRKPLLVEILSAGPVIQGGSALLQMEFGRVLLRTLALQGALLRLEQGSGSFGTDQVHVELQGALARNLLAQIGLSKTESQGVPAWEPFQFHLHGNVKNPEISFTSSFLSFSFKSRGEHN